MLLLLLLFFFFLYMQIKDANSKHFSWGVFTNILVVLYIAILWGPQLQLWLLDQIIFHPTKQKYWFFFSKSTLKKSVSRDIIPTILSYLGCWNFSLSNMAATIIPFVDGIVGENTTGSQTYLYNTETFFSEKSTLKKLVYNDIISAILSYLGCWNYIGWDEPL